MNTVIPFLRQRQMWFITMALFFSVLIRHVVGNDLGTPESINLGRLSPNEPRTFSFDVENKSDVPILIASVETTCSCTLMESPELGPLRPGEKRRYKATVNFGSLLGDYSTKIGMFWRKESWQKAIKTDVLITGKIVSIGVASVAHLDFGSVSFDDAPTGTVFEITRGNSGIAWDGIVASCDHSSVHATVVPINKDVFKLNVTFTPKGNFLKQIRTALSLRFVHHGTAIPGWIEIPLTARVTGPLAAAPHTMYLGAMKRNTRIFRTLEIRSTGPDLRAAKIASDDERISVEFKSKSAEKLLIKLAIDTTWSSRSPVVNSNLAVDAGKLRIYVPVIGMISDSEDSTREASF